MIVAAGMVVRAVTSPAPEVQDHNHKQAAAKFASTHYNFLGSLMRC
jgi:hypothetical protein